MIPPILLQELWTETNFRPNDEQLKAILHTQNPLFLTAGAGSGKTRVLLWRTLHLIVNERVRPEDILLTTFTDKAALQLKEGLRTYLGYVTNKNGIAYDISKMYIGTVHSVCKQILEDRRKFSNGQRIERVQMLDSLQQYFFIKSAKNWATLLSAGEATEIEINQYFEKGAKFNNKHKAITQLISIFNRFTEEQVNLDVLLEQTSTNEILHKFVKMYKAYLGLLKPNGGLEKCDFSLIQQKALALLEKHPKSKTAFKHIIVDEYQDTNHIQEKIFFHLADGYKNICVVGDDDQALYRFRGATVENFVEFPKRCTQFLGLEPTKIALNTNYRSRQPIVQFATDFLETIDWRKENTPNEFYRVHDKNIQAASQDKKAAVVTTTENKDELPAEVAQFVKALIDTKKVDNANQIAFLFPSLKSAAVQALEKALEQEGLKVYAPRASSFLDVNECVEIFGIFFKIFGTPTTTRTGIDLNTFKEWIEKADNVANNIIDKDATLIQFIKDKQEELSKKQQDYAALLATISEAQLEISTNYDPETMEFVLLSTKGLSDESKKIIQNSYFRDTVKKRLEGNGDTDEPPFTISNIINRVTSVDWSLLDLFYQICGFKHFQEYFALAENKQDEAPICNLGLITQYLSEFMDIYGGVLSAQFLAQSMFLNVFSWGYLYSLHRLGETEYENENDPFPAGRIPFITIHQSKGLEFPVVFLYPYRTKRSNPIENLMRTLHPKPQQEPLERVGEFDTMRMFYVGISRAENLLVVCNPNAYKRSGGHAGIKTLIDNQAIPTLTNFDLATLPTAKSNHKNKIVKPYSYTADYLVYDKCPRNYMIFRKYGFVPSRTQTMFFGSLVHQTIEDLHHHLIQLRNDNEN